MEVYIDSSIIFDSLIDKDLFQDPKKKEDREAIDKIIDLKRNNKIICCTLVNTEFEIAKDKRQAQINGRWGRLIKKDMAIGIKATVKKHYDNKWDERFNELKGVGVSKEIDASQLVQAEYFCIPYVISTDYKYINWSDGKSTFSKYIRPVDFIKFNKF